MSFEKINNVELPSESAVSELNKAIHTRVASVFFKRNNKIKDNLNNKKVGVRTGRLRSAQQVKTEQKAFTINATIFNNVSYASTLEFGFNGSVSVNQHKRKISQAFGKPIAPVFVNISAHKRHVNRKARSYFYSELQNIDEEIKDVIDSVVQEIL